MCEPFIGEIKLFGFEWVPEGWAKCDGTQLPISQNQALYSLLGNQFGQSSTSVFTLPDLRGRVPVGPGYDRTTGQQGGVENVTLSDQELAAHTHSFLVAKGKADKFANFGNYLLAPVGNQSIGGEPQPAFSNGAGNTSMASVTCDSVGGNQPHTNVQPSAVTNYCIALSGTYPLRN